MLGFSRGPKQKMDLENLGTHRFWLAGQATVCPKGKPDFGYAQDTMVWKFPFTQMGSQNWHWWLPKLMSLTYLHSHCLLMVFPCLPEVQIRLLCHCQWLLSGSRSYLHATVSHNKTALIKPNLSWLWKPCKSLCPTTWLWQLEWPGYPNQLQACSPLLP